MSDPVDQTPLLSLPYIQGAQAQKHVTHNEAIERLDMVVQLTVEALDATIPPANAAEGQAWIVGTGATGVWSSHLGDIAAWRGGGWLFVTPQIGWRAWNKTTSTIIAYDGTDWGQTSGNNLQNVSGVGINAAFDMTNKLAVAADATLLTHTGNGHQLKINKATASDTAALLYQSGFSGRAEMGLAGNDDFSVKVSADGSTFTEALRIDGTTGAVAMPATGTRQLIPFNHRYDFEPDWRWVGFSSDPATLSVAQNLGTGPEPVANWDAKGYFVPAGSVIRRFYFAGSASHQEIVDLDLRITFQHGPWNGAWNASAATTRVNLASANAAGLIGTGGMRRTTYALDYTTPADGYFAITARQDASSALTQTRYFYAAGALDLILPPNA